VNVEVYTRGERDVMTTKGRGLFAYIRKRKAICTNIFFGILCRKTALVAGKNGQFAYAEKRNALCTEAFFLLWMPEKMSVVYREFFPIQSQKKPA